MAPVNGGTTATAKFDPVSVVRALEQTLNPILKKTKLEIVNAGKYFHVMDLHDGIFNVQQLEKSGGLPIKGSGAITTVPCDPIYMSLVLKAWKQLRE